MPQAEHVLLRVAIVKKFIVAQSVLLSLKLRYYVNHSSNKSMSITGNCNLPQGKEGVFPQIHDKKWGFNDLQRRQIDLCTFIQGGCGSPKLLSTLNSIAFIPLPLQGH